MAKINKQGQITIPEDLRSALDIFPGMKFEAKINMGKIVLTPYCYKCISCGAQIPDGSLSRFCKKCSENRTTQVY